MLIDNIKNKSLLVFSIALIFLTGGISTGFAEKMSDVAMSEHEMKHDGQAESLVRRHQVRQL